MQTHTSTTNYLKCVCRSHFAIHWRLESLSICTWCVVATNVFLGKLSTVLLVLFLVFLQSIRQRLSLLHHFPIFFSHLTSYQWAALDSVNTNCTICFTSLLSMHSNGIGWSTTLTRKTNFKRKSIDKWRKKDGNNIELWTIIVLDESTHTHISHHIRKMWKEVAWLQRQRQQQRW